MCDKDIGILWYQVVPWMLVTGVLKPINEDLEFSCGRHIISSEMTYAKFEGPHLGRSGAPYTFNLRPHLKASVMDLR